MTINLSGQLARAAFVIGRDISPSSIYPLDRDAKEVISEHSAAVPTERNPGVVRGSLR